MIATAMVDARPKLENVNAVLIVYKVKVEDAYPGPPAVITKGMSNTCNAPLILSNNT